MAAILYCQHNCNIDINLPHSRRSTVRLITFWPAKLQNLNIL